MKLACSLLAVALAAVGTRAINAGTMDHLGDQYRMVDITWDVALNASHSISVNGTVEDVFRVLKKHESDVFGAIHARIQELALSIGNLDDDDDDDDDSNSNETNLDVGSDDGQGNDSAYHLLARSAGPNPAAAYMASFAAVSDFPHKPSLHFCEFRKNKPMWTRHVWRGIYHLDAVPGVPRAGPGPSTCGMVSCSHNTGITWCNDNTHDFELQSYKEIAAAAAMLVRDCASYYGKVVGQQFFADNWNVIVHNAKC
ncbi:hypothetical protein BD289DRAFT_478702 [Coniella lustricola]|uniref:Peptidase domain-containing protein n=1 Tax=Coniella lustricola TaxID=2025994 RepID=A0A2T3ALM6_9PEZI|nr:hypothetical protein BD289DRAFT_478702 [Coniella lustricola]